MRMVAGLIPFVAFVVLSRRLHRQCGSWRAAILAAAVVWGVAVTVVTEGLSLLHILSFGWVLTAWLVILAIYAMGRVPQVVRPIPPSRETSGPGRWGLALAAVALIAAAAGLVSVAAPPNTTDSIVYHMPRIAHWIQNGSVAHYPTHVPRQLHLGPWAEFAILQLQILTGGDRLANLVQWLAMLGSLIGVSLITQRFGGGVRGQILAVVVCATIPMGILQASSTQNDYVLSFWLVCFVHHLQAYLTGEAARDDTSAAWWMGASLGLAILTKATAYIFALPFLAWLVVAGWQRRARWARTMAILVLTVLAINAGHYARNVWIYGSPLGPGREGQFVYANETFGLATMISNALRNVALHIGTPNAGVNAALERAVVWLHRQAALEVDDPNTTWLGVTFHVTPSTTHEDFAGNLVHLFVIVLSVAILLTVRRLRRPDVLAYVSALVIAFLLFALYLKWQPWHSRLHLPLFVLWSPVVAMMWGVRRWMVGALVAVLLATSVIPVIGNQSRPLLGRESVVVRGRLDQYFVNRPDLRDPYGAAMKALKQIGCSKIGLWIDELPEYPLWVLAGRGAPQAPLRMEHVAVSNDSAKAARPGREPFDPCAILVITEHPPGSASLSFNRSVYRRTFQEFPVSLFVRD